MSIDSEPTLEPRRVLIVVPNRARDLEGHALVGYHLERHYQHRVYYCEPKTLEQKLLELCPDGIVLDHLGSESRAGSAQLAKQLGMKVFVLPTAGFFQDGEEDEEMIRAGKLLKVSGVVDLFFTWGDHARSKLLKNQIMSDGQVKTIGCPRFDFYSEPQRWVASTRSQFLATLGIHNPEAPLIVWPTNTHFSEAREFEKQIRNGKTNGLQSLIRDVLADGRTQYQELSRIVLALAQRNPNWNFLIKIHPSEWYEPYAKLTRQAPNVHLGFNLSIRELLCHCDVLLERWSTTATEAWMMGKPVLEVASGTYHQKARQEYVDGTDVVTTIPKVEEVIQRYISGGRIPPDQQRARELFLQKNYFRIDGKASERCAELIHRLLSPPHHARRDQAQLSANQLYGSWRRKEDGRLPNRVKDLIGIERQRSLRPWKRWLHPAGKMGAGLFLKGQEITLETVDRLYQQYDRVLAGHQLLSEGVVEKNENPL